MIALLAAPAVVLVAGEARASTLSSDDFNSDPDANGKWTIYRRSGDKVSESSWDPVAGTLYLTRAAGGKATAIFADHSLTAHAWTATFRYRTGNGLTGGGCDGFVFMFYKNQQPYASSAPQDGAALGFTTAANGVVAGYGVAFNEWRGNAVRLIKDSANTELASVTDARVADNAWHTATVRFDNGGVTVGIDGDTVLDAVISTPDYTYTGVGFSGATGGGTPCSNHEIDDFQLADAGPPAAPRNLQALPDAITGRVTLTWLAPASDGGTQVTNYLVYRSALGAPEAFLADAGVGLEYADDTCTAVYCTYRVSAKNAAGEEGPKSASATAPGRSPSGIDPIGDSGALSESVLYRAEGVAVAPATPLPPAGTPGQSTPDYPGTSPIPTPLGLGATLVVCDSGAATGCDAGGAQLFLCADLQVTTASGPTTVPLACVQKSQLQGADGLVPRGPTPLVGSTLVPGTPPLGVPDVPPMPAGSLGSTPALTATIDARYTYAPSHLGPGFGVLGHAFYQPFLATPQEALWFLTHGSDLALSVSVTIYADGDVLQTWTANAPWLGQLLAAAGAQGV